MPTDQPITAQLFNGRPSMPGQRSSQPTSKKRALSTAANLRRVAKRLKGEVEKGEKRTFKTVTLEDYPTPIKRPHLLGPSSGSGVGVGCIKHIA